MKRSDERLEHVGYEDEWGRLYLDETPKGWREVRGAMTAPVGFKWVCNGASRFDSERAYRNALVRAED